MELIEFLKAALFGIVEGITEWLPISSTGHMILLDEFVTLKASPEFMEMFLVVIQLGAILAVALLYFWDLWPLKTQRGKVAIKWETLSMWGKIIVACLPAAVVGLLFDDQLNALFYNWQTVAIMLILFGVLFLIIERYNQSRKPSITKMEDISYKTALLVGVFQLIAAVFPGTSRSGATILGGLLIGLSRPLAAEFTFYLAVPVMFGASLLKLVKFGLHFTGAEVMVLLIGMITAFLVSIVVIKFLMSYIRRHDFKVFGWYRIVLGVIVLLYFGLRTIV